MNWFSKFFDYIGRLRYIPNQNNILMLRHHILFRDNIDGENNYIVVNENGSKRIDATKAPYFNAYIHNIRRSDIDVHHDHPWNYFTLIIAGGYYENTPEGRFWRGPGYFGFYKAESLHWLEIPEGKDCWTLFVHFKRRRIWGFKNLETGEWINHIDYKEKRNEKLWEKALGNPVQSVQSNLQGHM